MSETTTEQASGDWATQILDAIDGFIDTIRSKTTDPLRQVVRGIVLAVMCVGLALAIFFLLVIGLIRALNQVMPGTWSVYLLLGSLFCAGGLVLWTRRYAKA